MLFRSEQQLAPHRSDETTSTPTGSTPATPDADQTGTGAPPADESGTSTATSAAPPGTSAAVGATEAVELIIAALTGSFGS